MRKLADGLGTWGDIFIKMGEVEKLEREVGDFTKLLRKLQRLGPPEFLAILQNNPELQGSLQAFYESFNTFAAETGDKDLWDLSADEQIELGRRCKDFSRLISKIADCMG